MDPAEHAAWLRRRLEDPATRLWIGLDQTGEPVGQVRLQGEPGDGARFEVSISVEAGSRGRGLGRALLAAACRAADEDLRIAGLTARVRAENPASLRLFEGQGFQRVDVEEGVVRLAR